MNPQADNFEQIRKLLALKRHEQPPPGYFEHLSARIISRIESVESGRPTLWERLGFAFGSKPAFVCALGVVACGLICERAPATTGLRYAILALDDGWPPGNPQQHRASHQPRFGL
jgi:hypothetical protein